MNEIKIGIIGFGTVGAGAAGCLLKNADIIAARTGVKVKLHKIADLDITTDRGVTVPNDVLTTDSSKLIDECDVVVELIGGTTISKKLILEALSKGKSVVTANKALLAEHGEELFKTANENNADIYYEASVAGGIPIIKSLREGFSGNRINRVYGILNGTCNYILTRMEREKSQFAPILADAQKLGYAELNPSLDIDGFDTAHKAAILASLSYGSWFSTSDVHVEGITKIELDDIAYASDLGYRIKLLAIIKQNAENNVELRVHPTLIKKTTQLAGINEVFNGVMVNGDYVGDALFCGRGAGREATASAVVADIVDVSVNIAKGCSKRLPSHSETKLYGSIIPMDDVVSRYYIRLNVSDKPGVMGSIATLLSDNAISISSVVQHNDNEAEEVSIIILTHKAVEKNMRGALAAIGKLPELKGDAKLIRIEDI